MVPSTSVAPGLVITLVAATGGVVTGVDVAGTGVSVAGTWLVGVADGRLAGVGVSVGETIAPGNVGLGKAVNVGGKTTGFVAIMTGWVAVGAIGATGVCTGAVVGGAC